MTEDLGITDVFWDGVEKPKPEIKTPISIRVDADILDFFKSQGRGHLTRMHDVLRFYVDQKKGAGK